MKWVKSKKHRTRIYVPNDEIKTKSTNYQLSQVLMLRNHKENSFSTIFNFSQFHENISLRPNIFLLRRYFGNTHLLMSKMPILVYSYFQRPTISFFQINFHVNNDTFPNTVFKISVAVPLLQCFHYNVRSIQIV